MASIKLTRKSGNAQNIGYDGYTFVDERFDLTKNEPIYDFRSSSLPARELEFSYDEDAIKNSLINIFGTVPGQRFLIPEFGCNLAAFLFQPITDLQGEIIGRTIYRAIEIWEPRVSIDGILVVGKPDQNQYDITIEVSIPRLKKQTKLTGVLSQNGFKESNG